jgi:transcriptional regulator with XRE-family HTH domain
MNAQEFRSIRTRLGLTQPELAAILNVSERAIRDWEKGVRGHRVIKPPYHVGLLMRLMVNHELVRREFGISLERKAALQQADPPIAAAPRQEAGSGSIAGTAHAHH